MISRLIVGYSYPIFTSTSGIISKIKISKDVSEVKGTPRTTTRSV